MSIERKKTRNRFVLGIGPSFGFISLNVHVVFQTREDVLVGPGHHDALGD